MIDHIRGLAVFVAVADAGSFSAAARRLKLSTSVVSHHITKLEAKLGAPLFFRSTRALSLSQEGQTMLGAARRMVEAGEEAIDLLSDANDQPMGTLRLSLPAFGEKSRIHQAIWRFASTHPMVSLSVQSSDSPVDLIKEGYDLAIRVGILEDSTLKSRRIGTFKRTLVAAPSYLKTRPPIEQPDDLCQHDFVALAMLPLDFTLARGGENITIKPGKPRLEVDSVAAARSAVLAGLGLQRMPNSEMADDLKAGDVVQVLPEWSLPDLGVYAVWPDNGSQRRLTRHLLDHLAGNAELA